VNGDAGIRLASAGSANPELIRNLVHGLYASAHQDFKQKFEARGLEGQTVDAAAMDDKKPRHRVGDLEILLRNQRRCGERAQPGNGGTQRIPTLGSVILSVACSAAFNSLGNNSGGCCRSASITPSRFAPDD